MISNRGLLFSIYKSFGIEMQAFVCGKSLPVTADDTHVRVLPKHRAPPLPATNTHTHCLILDISEVKALRAPQLIYSSKGIMNVWKISRQSTQ